MIRRGSLIVFAAMILLLSRQAWGNCNDGNLIEYGCGFYGDGGAPMATLAPPFFKIYESGLAVFWRDGRFYSGHIDPKRLEHLRTRLRRERLLSHSQVLPCKHPGFMGMHGGLCYLRYGRGPKEIIIATEGRLERVPWLRLVRLIRSYQPTVFQPFYPPSLTATLTRSWGPGLSCTNRLPNTSAFAEKIQAHVGTEYSDMDLIVPIMDNLRAEYVSFQSCIQQGKVCYFFDLTKVPNWYDDCELDRDLFAMVASWHEQRQPPEKEP
jgi:hypothetical protein